MDSPSERVGSKPGADLAMHAMRRAGRSGCGIALPPAVVAIAHLRLTPMPEADNAVEMQRLVLPSRRKRRKIIATARRAIASIEARYALSILHATIPARPAVTPAQRHRRGTRADPQQRPRHYTGRCFLCGGGAPEHRAFLDFGNYQFTCYA